MPESRLQPDAQKKTRATDRPTGQEAVNYYIAFVIVDGRTKKNVCTPAQVGGPFCPENMKKGIEIKIVQISRPRCEESRKCQK